MNARRLASVIVVTLCAVVGGLVFSGAPALAEFAHGYLSQITEVPTGSGAPLPGKLSGVNAMTVDSGDLWVAEQIEGTTTTRVDEFDASGSFLSQLNETEGVKELKRGVAVGHATGESRVYVGAVEEISGKEEGVVAVFDPATGALIDSWTGAGTPGAFGLKTKGGVADVAADNSTSALDWAKGDVYVVDANHKTVDVFEPQADGSEKYVTQITGFSAPGGVVVDQSNGDVAVVASGSVVDVFAPKPTELEGYELVHELTGTPGGALEDLSGVAVGGGAEDGDIYVASTATNVVYQFNFEGDYLDSLTGTPAGAFGSARSVAVNPEAPYDVYVGDNTAGVVDVFGPDLVIPDVTTAAPSTATLEPETHTWAVTLKGEVNPDSEGEATCQFVWGATEEFGQTAACSAHVPEGDSPVPVEATLSGLEPDTTYYYRLQAINKNAVLNPGLASEDRQFTTPGPGMHGESASDVASSSATLDATIGPDGDATSYYFQYGTEACATAIHPCETAPAPPGAGIGSEPGPVDVSRHLQGLAAATTYHYRVVAVSELEVAGVFKVEEFDGPDQTFTTQRAGEELELPDGRAWELVSPPNKHGGLINPINDEDGVIQAAEDGDAITYGANTPIIESPSANALLDSRTLSTRGPDGWSSQDINTPNEAALGVHAGFPSEYELFSSDLSHALVQPPGEAPPSLAPGASGPTLYLRDDTDGAYQALAKAPAATGVELRGATPDMSHVVFSSGEVGLDPDYPAAHGLYEWAGGHVQLVSVLPTGEPGGAGVDSGGLGSRHEVRDEVSDTGSRVVFSSGTHLYLRDTTKGETVELDAVQEGEGEGTVYPRFQTASASESRLFFTDEQELTADSKAKSGAPDLYVCEVIEEAGKLACKLTDLTADTNAGESANVQGEVPGTGEEDGSYVYFVADGVLGDAENGRREKAVSGEDNLYEMHYDGSAWETPTFIATLSSEDAPDWGGSTEGGLRYLTSRVSPNGRYLAFMSDRSLTGYDNLDVNSGEPDEEVFLYHAEAGAGAGRLVCASCDPSGARPLGVLDTETAPGLLVDRTTVWGGRWLAGSVPGWTSSDLSVVFYQSRYLSNGGRLFFDSADALVPQDVNGKEDVYEYEPPGEGSCTSSSATFSERSEGCIGLISAGTSGEESAFLDASANGDDVFFLTASALVKSDVDTALDVYDAHVCGAEGVACTAAATASPPCTTADSCRAAPASQPGIFGAPPSATFSGAGNLAPTTTPAVKAKAKPLTRAQKLSRALKACKRDKPKTKRAVCVRKARKRYGASKAKKAGNKRRAKS